jgi:hypothetical protein
MTVIRYGRTYMPLLLSSDNLVTISKISGLTNEM